MLVVVLCIPTLCLFGLMIMSLPLLFGTGEDRWMATLMMIKGWRMRYSPFADNTTYCPDTFQVRMEKIKSCTKRISLWLFLLVS